MRKDLLFGLVLGVVGVLAVATSVSAQVTDGVNLSVTVDESISLSCGSDVDIDGGTSLSPGTPESNSTTCTVTTNDEDGYNLQIADDNGGSNALTNGSYSITDHTAWNPSAPNGAAWVDGTTTGLGFSVYASTATKNTVWWGTGSSCHDANNLYAGLPDTDTNIMEHASYESGSTTTSVCYRVDVPATQASGEYTGSVTYTATGRP
jgi:hypothetical protein